MRAPTKSVLLRITWPAPNFPSRTCIRAFWLSCWKVCSGVFALTGTRVMNSWPVAEPTAWSEKSPRGARSALISAMLVSAPRPGPGVRLIVYGVFEMSAGRGKRHQLRRGRGRISLDVRADARDSAGNGLGEVTNGRVVGIAERVVFLGPVLGAGDREDDVARGGERRLSRRDGDLDLVGAGVLDREARRGDLELECDPCLEVDAEVESAVGDVADDARRR